MLFPLPFPLPPGQSAGLPRGWACTFAQGGGGMGGGILFGLEFAQDHGSFSLFCGVFFGLHMVFCRNATPGLRFPYCHNTKHGCPHIPSVSKVPPIVHTSVPKTASHSTPTLPPLYQKCDPQYTPSVPKTASHSTPTLPPLYQNAIHSTHPQYQKLLPTVHPHYHPLYQKCNPLYTPLYQKMIPTGPPQFTPLYQK